MTSKEIEDRITEMFEQNYEMLKLEGGHSLTLDTKKSALMQVLFYYRKLKLLAENVTETEVKLTLPEQLTPDGRKFSIEGIVDIVCKENEVRMYDIKTHDPDYIEANKQLYEKQLNVYAHIYQNLRGNKLDHTSVISTAFPENLKNAIVSEDENKIEEELVKWKPIIDIPFDENKVQETIQDFALVVDKIEKKCFTPPSAKTLKSKIEATNTIFATRICSNCDARFSCESFREYILKYNPRTKGNFNKYFQLIDNDINQL